jgi:succinyl-diaminopimelate desuccinylase
LLRRNGSYEIYLGGLLKNLNSLIEADRDALILHTQELIRINSVESEAKQGMPFGEGIHEALTYVLKLADGFWI